MFRKNTHERTDAALEQRVRELVSPLAGAEPAKPAARSALRHALHRAEPPRPHGLRAWQRAAVGLAGVVVPLFAAGSVAGLGADAVTAPLDAVAGVFKSNGPVGGGPDSVTLAAEEDPASDDAAVASSCEDATAAARAELEALLESDVLNDSAAAGVSAALAALADCGGDGAAACFEATATAQEVLQALLDTETLPEEGRGGIETALAAIEACGPAEGSTADETDEDETTTEETAAATSEDGRPGTGHETCFDATEHAREILQGLLDDEDRPEQSKKGIERALEAIENCGTGNGKDEEGDGTSSEDTSDTTATGTAAASTSDTAPSKKPETAGRPENPGAAAIDHKPANAGPSGDTGKPDAAGRPEDAGNPHGTAGAPTGAGDDHGGKPDNPGSAAGEHQAGPPDHAGPPESSPSGGPASGPGTAGSHGNSGGPASKPGRP